MAALLLFQVLGVVATLLPFVSANFHASVLLGGPHWVTTDENYVVQFQTVLTPGFPPQELVGSLAIWPGVLNCTSYDDFTDFDLVQTVVQTGSLTENEDYCGGSEGQW